MEKVSRISWWKTCLSAVVGVTLAACAVAFLPTYAATPIFIVVVFTTTFIVVTWGSISLRGNGCKYIANYSLIDTWCTKEVIHEGEKRRYALACRNKCEHYCERHWWHCFERSFYMLRPSSPYIHIDS